MTGAIIGTSALVGVLLVLSEEFIRSIWPENDYALVHDCLDVCVYRFSLADHVLSFFLLNALNGLCRSFLSQHQEHYYQI